MKNRSKRNIKQLPEIPGPGSYTPVEDLAPGRSFSRSHRPVCNLSGYYFEDLPGPGTYNLPKEASKAHLSPFNSSSNRFSPINKNAVPGPGAYDSYKFVPKLISRSTLQKQKGFALSVPPSIPLLERHENAYFDGIKDKAGPWDYEPSFSQVKNKPTIPVFGLSARCLWDKTNPNTKINSRHGVGPGLYLKNSARAKAPFTNSPRFLSKITEELSSYHPLAMKYMGSPTIFKGQKTPRKLN